jgi:hypothetical protein
MSKTLEEIRRKLQALDNKKGGAAGSYSGDKTTYAHWNIAEGTSATLRFAPDGNEDNTLFWVEKQIIKLPFAGILGQDEHKPVEVQVPCIEMWDGPKTCPVLNEVRPMWKDTSLEATARKYWVKRTYFMQGFVKQDPMGDAESPENPIRKFIIGPQIYAIIKAALMDPDMENSPVDYINGTDFIVSKTSKGGYADYGTSKWARKESSLSEEMLEAIDKYGLVDLASYLPKRPTAEQLGIIFEMFQASLDGELYDPKQWAQHYKPFGFDSGSKDDDGEGTKPAARVQVPVSKPVVTPKVVEQAEEAPWTDDDTPTEAKEEKVVETVAATSNTGKSPQEILAMLRSRNK